MISSINSLSSNTSSVINTSEYDGNPHDQMQQYQQPQRQHLSIWVGDLPEHTARDELVAFFGTFPEYLDLYYMKKTCSAFVNFMSRDAAEGAAMHFHGKHFKNIHSRDCISTLVPAASLSAIDYPMKSPPFPSSMYIQQDSIPFHLNASMSGRGSPVSPMGFQTHQMHNEMSFATNPPSLSRYTGLMPESLSPTIYQSFLSSHSPAHTLQQQYNPHNRYIIMKSISVEDLEYSVKHSVWATQSHLEPVLDTAFKTADNVYLIFSVNKSGEFFGFARMMSQVSDNKSIPWSVTLGKTGTGHNNSYIHLSQSNGHDSKSDAITDDMIDPLALAAKVVSSNCMTAQEQIRLPSRVVSLQERLHGDLVNQSNGESNDTTSVKITTSVTPTQESDRRAKWGGAFQVQWILLQRLPFWCVRHLHNPWNYNREVKVSRDGIELETNVGYVLIQEFYRFYQHQVNMFMQGLQPIYLLPSSLRNALTIPNTNNACYTNPYQPLRPPTNMPIPISMVLPPMNIYQAHQQHQSFGSTMIMPPIPGSMYPSPSSTPFGQPATPIYVSNIPIYSSERTSQRDTPWHKDIPLPLPIICC